MADGAREHLTVDIHLELIIIGDMVVGLTKVFAGIFCHHIHRGDEP